VKLVIAIVHSKDADACISALTNAGFVCTRFASFGGFLDKNNVTLMIGVEAAQVASVIEIIRSRAKQRNELLEAATPVPAPIGVLLPSPVEVEVGGATVFVIDVDQFEKV
jgi:uncharacterized protein YaaQ